MNDIEIYKTAEGQTQIEVRFENESVWLSLNQIAALFERDKSVISRHLKNIYTEGELEEKSTVAKNATVQNEAGRVVKRKIEYYNLDVIISIGYRVNSKRGTQFRQWTTHRLKDYLVKGFSVNEKRLKEKENQLLELKKTVELLNNVVQSQTLSNDETRGLFKVLNDYAFALDILDKYDHQTLKNPETGAIEQFRITYHDARQAINGLKNKFGGSSLFGNEKDQSFRSSLDTIYQTFDGTEL